MNVLLFLGIGLLAGVLTRKATGTSMTASTASALGVFGALLGGFLLGLLGPLARGAVGSLLGACVGAVGLLLLVGLVQRTA